MFGHALCVFVHPFHLQHSTQPDHALIPGTRVDDVDRVLSRLIDVHLAHHDRAESLAVAFIGRFNEGLTPFASSNSGGRVASVARS